MPKVATPKGLGSDGSALFEAVLSDYAITDAAHRAHLQRAAEALDRIVAARAELRRSGLTIRDRHGVPRPHPLIAIERAALSAYFAAFRALRLEPPEV